MFQSTDISKKKDTFIEQTKSARKERQEEKQRDDCAIRIQSLVRGFICRSQLKKSIRYEIHNVLDIPKDNVKYTPTLKSAAELHVVLNKFLFIHNSKDDAKSFEYVCKYILYGMEASNTRYHYVSLTLSKKHVVGWIQQLKRILWQCCLYLKQLKPESVNDMKVISTYLHMLVTFTSTASWKILNGKTGEALKPGMNKLCCNVMGYLNSRGLYPALQVLLMNGLARSEPLFKYGTLSAILTVALRPLVAANFSDSLLTVFLLHILSVPAVVHHVTSLAEQCLVTLTTHRIFKRCLDLMSNEQSTRIIFNSLEGNYALCLLANMVQLGNFEIEGLVDNTEHFIRIVTRLLESCQQYVQSKRSNLTHWHPVLGWFSQKTDQRLHESMPHVVTQLQLLWSSRIIRILFSDLMSHADTRRQLFSEQNSAVNNTKKNPLKKALDKVKSSSSSVKMESSVVVTTCRACSMYATALTTLTQLRVNILAGLSSHKFLLPNIWLLICDLGPNCGLNAFLDLLTSSPNNTHHASFQMLTLFAEAASHLIVILDDMELFEQQKPFKIEYIASMATFFNHFVVKLIWNNLIDIKDALGSRLFTCPHTLLMILYERDCRRSFTTTDGAWLIRDIKPSLFLQEIEKKKKTAEFLLRKVPHIIPHKERVIMFRKIIQREKESLGLIETSSVTPQSTLITVHRPRLLEDGYRQLSLLPTNGLKGIIRVKFVNVQGLDEAGIDQDGVFKEFLEETISRVFDPSLNLFKITSDQKLYPSPTSHVQDNHLDLFEFVGRMLGKAVYEGIVVEVPFAPFFLTQILGRTHSATYSFVDDLPSLDAELYRNITFVKHYDDDVSDLGLTFSCDEDHLGKLVSHELVPGGRSITVTSENKIAYVHSMAHFRMFVQIKEQTKAFTRGFRSIINPEWLMMFSAPELQKLISGDNVDVDLQDLRCHVQYYGGFHNGHRVVSWLWDVLQKDFSKEERGLFLKFVTSCSKPPLLGFAHLEPPFSIRCVDTSDDQDTGDTVGSVLKGFFNIKKRDPVGRLPTSSTCFNLLKLPNYQKKSTLREKLRYAITSNTGFELS